MKSRIHWFAVILFATQVSASVVDPRTVGLEGGLVVQLGAADITTPVALSRTGRYLVNVLDPDPSVVGQARKQLRAEGHYGLASVEHVADLQRLPYTENLVNLVIAGNVTMPAAEILRVLAPEGSVIVALPKPTSKGQLNRAGFLSIREVRSADGRLMLTARKPWPKGMDGWSHPRHGADGNAVSRDTLVAPPERVRWIAAATREIEGLVTAGGRNFYGGVLARDSFNGLRLWHLTLTNAQPNAAVFELPSLAANLARPVASDDQLFAVANGKLVAFDTGTGKTVREFTGISRPRQLACYRQTVVAADTNAVCAFDARTGGTLWRFEAVNANNLIVGCDIVSFIHGQPTGARPFEAVALDVRTGRVKWRCSDYPWLAKVSRTVLYGNRLAFEVSTLNDHDRGNSLHLVSATTGKPLWEKAFPPGMNHNRQSRAMFADNRLWVLHGGKTNTLEKTRTVRLPIQISALDPANGKTLVTHPAWLTHCFPPVATPNYMLSGVLHLTDFRTGKMVANPITKANCSREGGWVPANGLIYTTPKHCTCWPMLRGYVALAPRAPGRSPANLPISQLEFPVQKGPARADTDAADPQPSDWPLYRNDPWRSGSTTAAGPKSLNRLWAVQLAPKAEVAMLNDAPIGPILHDWRDNAVVKGPLSAPTVANGFAYVARPDAHEVIAVDARSGQVRWRFTAEGRVDSPPAIHRGLCLFGSASGHVYALRADTGELVWRMRVAPTDERIVVCGQVESPWPVPGAILIMNGCAYFAAGRQSLADGGILLLAVDPMTGERRWVSRLDNIPHQDPKKNSGLKSDPYYENSGLEFDPFDILHQEGDGITLSRWKFSCDLKEVNVDKWNAFAAVNTGGGTACVPRGWWTYSPRHQHRFPGEPSRRPLCVFRDRTLFSSLDGATEIFRRDFNLEQGEVFIDKWITGWAAASSARAGGTPYRNHRLAEKAAWKFNPYAPAGDAPTPRPPGAQLYNELHALALSGDGCLFVVHKDGRLKSLSTQDGRVLAETQVPQPAWDGLAIAGQRLFLTTQTGELLCLGE
ncbi:MAG: PQQ-binding-like beta-propeller repeat protein [Verrucomicrobia bacterium]|nr:PQQ-binding-like beta-propeller repeat protein [Verrucomicrobiota bacterium]